MNFLFKLKKYFENIADALLYFEQRTIFKSSGQPKTLYGITFYDLKKTKEVNPNKIHTYPRITIFEKNHNRQEDKIIFDSSDFKHINNYLCSFARHFSLGSKFDFNDFDYEVVEIKIEILDSFDDYSTIFRNNSNHSETYSGADTPYNIQIMIYVTNLE
jgi:hypothetical protein